MSASNDRDDVPPEAAAKATAVPDETVPADQAAAPAADDAPRSRRSSAAKVVLESGAHAIGEGIGTLGGGVAKLGEGVTKLGDLSRGVPVVGSSVQKLGEGISQVGGALHELPQVAKTRRGRLLIRSAIVGFVLVAGWIAVIVGLQLYGNDTPDFRPDAERILLSLSNSPLDDVYEQASPRLQEFERKDRFIDDMTDTAQMVGKFREITAVNESLVTTGTTGQIGRVSLTVAYEKATCKVSVSLHYDQERWKLLGISVDLPPELKITQAQREQRVKACDDPLDAKKCDVHQAVDAILHRLAAGHADEVWDDATQIFQKQGERAKFVERQREQFASLGNYRRIIAVTEAKKAVGTNTATFDAVAEFDRASGVRTVFGLFQRTRQDPWKLRSFKIVVPMPRGPGH